MTLYHKAKSGYTLLFNLSYIKFGFIITVLRTFRAFLKKGTPKTFIKRVLLCGKYNLKVAEGNLLPIPHRLCKPIPHRLCSSVFRNTCSVNRATFCPQPSLPNGIISKFQRTFLCNSPFVLQKQIIHIILIDEILKKW